jgi:hypothetical protein
MPSGSGSSGSSGTQNVTTTAQPPSFQMPSLQRLMGFANTIAETPLQTFPGQTTAPFTPEQVGAQQNLVNFAQGSAAPLVSQAIAANQFGLGPMLDPASDPTFQATLQNAAFPIVRNFQQEILPSIISQTQGAGQSAGDSRSQIAQGLAAQAAIDSIANQSTQLAAAQRSDVLDAFTKSQALAPSLISAGTIPATIQGSVGDIRQGFNQGLLNDAINQFNFQQQEPTARAQTFQNLIGGNFGGTTQSQGTARGAQPSTFESILSGALFGANAAPGLANTGLFGSFTAGQLAPFTIGTGALLGAFFGGG